MVQKDEVTPSLWFVLHTFAASFPEKPTEADRQDFITLLEKLGKRFPCGICGAHMAEYLKTHDPYAGTESNLTLQRWVYDFHDAVNVRLGKKVRPTFEEVLKAFAPGPWTGLLNYPVTNTQYPLKMALPNGPTPTATDTDDTVDGWMVATIVLMIVVAVMLLGGGYWAYRTRTDTHNSVKRKVLVS